MGAENQISRPLRVALLFETLVQPAWVIAAVENISNSDFVEISSIAYIKDDLDRKYGAIYKAYQRFDCKFFQTKPDPFFLSSIESILPDYRPCHLESILDNGFNYISTEQLTSAGLNLADVCIFFGRCRLKGDILNTPRFGVWAYGGENDWYSQEEGAWATLKGWFVTGVALWILQENPKNDIPIYRSFSSTVTHSVNLNYKGYLWKAAEFILRKLRDVYLNGPQALSPIQTDGNSYGREHGIRSAPSNQDVIQAFPRLIKCYLQSKLEMAVHKPQWFIAYQHGNAPSDGYLNLSNCVYLDPPLGCHWADPFPYIKNGRKYIFFEEIPLSGKKGHIAVIDLDEIQEILPLHKKEFHPTIVLERDYHLSYPFLMEWQGSLFMIPESSLNNSVELYRCIQFPDKWEFETKLIEGIKAVDSTLVEIDQHWWLFTNIADLGGNRNDELSLFYSLSPLGPWQAHPTNPIISDVRLARPAGNIIQLHGNFYRPAQDCSGRYGRQIVINQIIEITPTTYKEKAVCVIQPDWRKHLLANHTLNFTDNLMVIDGYRSTKGFY